MKKGTGFYMIIAVLISSLLMYCNYMIAGEFGAILTGLLILIAITAAIRYNQ